MLQNLFRFDLPARKRVKIRCASSLQMFKSMADTVKEPTVAEPVKETATVEKPADPAAKPADETSKTIEQIQEETVPEAKPKETVGLDKFLDLKKENKELKKSMEDLQKQIEEGATSKDIASSLDAISEEYPDVNKDFLKKLANTIKAQVEKDADDRIEKRVKPLEAKEKAAKLDAAFTQHFNAAMEKMPEFKSIVNAAVIKTLSLDPANRNKTFSQLIEETYGNALTGKRTIDTTAPGGGKDAETLDFTKARKDGDYFDHVMATPALKKEYNERMLKEGL